VFEVSVHWIQFTMPEEVRIEDTVKELRGYLDSPFESVGHGAWGYEDMSIGIAGSRLLTSAKRPEHHVELPGGWCESVGAEKCRTLLEWVTDNKGHFTRIDLAGDDYSKVITPKGVAKKCKKGELVSHCHHVTRNYSVMGKVQDVLYIGSPKSFRRLRVYDKNAESDGEIDAIRWELQLRDEAAYSAFELVYENSLPEAYLSTLVGFADFRQVKNSNVTRRQRTRWFKRIVGEAQKATLSVSKPVRTIEQTEAWLRKQAAPSLAMIVKAKGGDLGIIEDMVIEGGKRLKPVHRMAIEESLRSKSLN